MCKINEIMMKRVLLTAFGLSLISACVTTEHSQTSLHQRLGGQRVIEQITSDLLDKTSQHDATKRSFEGVKLNAVKESLSLYLCAQTGGNCIYEGETMKNSHADANITTAEFEMMVEQLREVLNHHGIGTREKNELLKILAPTKRDIVSPSQ